MTDTGIAGSITSDKGNGTGRGARKTKVEGSSIKGAEGFQFAKGFFSAADSMPSTSIIRAICRSIALFSARIRSSIGIARSPSSSTSIPSRRRSF